MNAALAFSSSSGFLFSGVETPVPARRLTPRSKDTAQVYDVAFDFADSLARVRQGDQEAARELVDVLHPLVIGIVRARHPRRTDEQDLVQEIFLKVFSRLDQYRGAMPFPHWVARISTTTCIDHLRLWKRRPEYRLADLSEEEAGASERALVNEHQVQPNDAVVVKELVGRLLGALEPKDQMVIRLLDLEQKSVAQIEALTGWSQSVIKVRAFRARRKLRKLFLELRQTERA
jgi:RNA polymerase sigma-70 factor (ECF subfamily)